MLTMAALQGGVKFFSRSLPQGHVRPFVGHAWRPSAQSRMRAGVVVELHPGTDNWWASSPSANLCRQTASTLSERQNRSMTALSRQRPTLPIDVHTPAASTAPVKAALVNCALGPC